jgi:hypothetical protein
VDAPGYIGCFAEGDGCGPNADSKPVQKAGNTPNIERCRYLAGALGSAYAAPAFHRECYTSADLPSEMLRQGRSGDGMCNAVCSGSNETKLEYCGGACYVSLYRALNVSTASGKRGLGMMGCTTLCLALMGEMWVCDSARYGATDIGQPKQVLSLKLYIMQG